MPKTTSAKHGTNRYQALIEKMFFDHYTAGAQEVLFHRDELEPAAKKLKIELPKNLGDVPYSVRYRTSLPAKIVATQPADKEWVIEGVGRSRYAFRLAKVSRIAPNPNLVTIKIPDATPEIISAYALSDEQALLAKVRYNRLIDIFLGIATYSMQSHLRTSVKEIGQIEIDEVYVGVDRAGRHFIVPVQAKGGSDKLSPVQTKQDIACCVEKFPGLICRAISAQFVEDDLIALLELTLENGMIKVVDEAHYRLVAAEEISAEELAGYRSRTA
ncbi:MAG: endonuclease [Opitutaceae bacterium]